QAEDGIRDGHVTGVQTCALPICFHLTGTIKGQKVDETFTSGPSTFSDVDDPSGVEFPVKDPTAGELTTRLDRELPRVTATAQARSEERRVGKESRCRRESCT